MNIQLRSIFTTKQTVWNDKKIINHEIEEYASSAVFTHHSVIKLTHVCVTRSSIIDESVV